MTGWDGKYIRLEQALLVGKFVLPRIHADGQVVPRLQGDERAVEEDQFWAGQTNKVSTQSLSTWNSDAESQSLGFLPHTCDSPYLPR